MTIEWTRISAVLYAASLARSTAGIAQIAHLLSEAIHAVLANLGRGNPWLKDEQDNLAQTVWVNVLMKVLGNKDEDWRDQSHAAGYIISLCRYALAEERRRRARRAVKSLNEVGEADMLGQCDRSHDLLEALDAIQTTVAAEFNTTSVDWAEFYFLVKRKLLTQRDVAGVLGMDERRVSEKIQKIEDWIRERFGGDQGRAEPKGDGGS